MPETSSHLYLVEKYIKQSSAGIKTIEGHSSLVESLKLISKEFLASGDYYGTIKMWNLRDHSCVQTLKGHTKCVSSLDSIVSN